MASEVHSTKNHKGIPGVVGVLSTTTGIDGKAVAATNLYTVPASKRAIITGAVVRVTEATNLTVTGTAGVGVAAGEADILPAVVMTGLLAVGQAFPMVPVAIMVTVAAAGVIKLGIDVGMTATSVTLAVDLLGYLIDA